MDPSQQPPQPPVPSEPQTPRPKKRGGCLKIAGIVVAALIVLGVIGALTSGPEDKQSTPTSSNSVPAAEETQASQPDETEPAATPTPDQPAELVVKPKEYAGTGNRIVKISKPSGEADEPVIATITHNGSSNFAVWTLNKKLDSSDGGVEIETFLGFLLQREVPPINGLLENETHSAQARGHQRTG